MGVRLENKMMNQKVNLEGLLLIGKPIGMTSHDVVDVVRKKLKIKKVGHAGTLDPLAQGLMIILVGKYTKFFSKFVSFDKEYLGVVKLGEVTSTGDSEGRVLKTGSYENVTSKDIKEACSCFLGEIDQIPPMVSAIRQGGKRLYSLARKGLTVERAARRITIFKLDILKIEIPLIELFIKCSKGTYIRKLAEDIGEKLSCGAHVIKIKRLAIGPFKLDEAISLEEIDKKHLKTISLW